MKIDTAGNYTLRYTATDSCGNSSSVDRPLIVATPRTVLYTDGTLIINEQPKDMAKNEALHGVATNTYIPFNPNGSTNQEKYIFGTVSSRLWNSQTSSIKSVEIGNTIKPTSTKYWFQNFSNCTSINLSNLDTSLVTDMSSMFGSCYALTDLDLSNLNTSSVANMSSMFNGCRKLTSLDLSGFNTGSVTNMSNMFDDCRTLTSLNLSSFNTSSVTNMSNMFNSCYALTSLDLSSFDTSSVTNMSNMFTSCKVLTVIYATVNFIIAQEANSSFMFAGMSTNLVGGAGTTWSSSKPTDKTYARIDNPPDAPGYFTLKPTA